MTVTIIQREQWGAVHPDGFATLATPATELWLHHSVTLAPDLLPPYDDDDAAIRTLERIGQQRFGGGISYTFAVTPVGRLYEGHSVNRRGAHTGGHNTAGRGIVLVGDYTVTPPTRAQVEVVGRLIRHGREQGWWRCDRLSGGHRDTKPTGCPGDAGYRSIAEINKVALGQAVPPPAAPQQPWKPTPTTPHSFIGQPFPLPAGHYLGPPSRDRRCHSGFYSAGDRKIVRLWQAGMRKRGWNITVDGLYGPSSARVCGLFQREKRLAVDGLVGRVTWTATDTLPR